MKSKNVLCCLAITVVVQLGMLAGSAQTNKYLFSGSETNITLPPGTYIITAYGAPGAYPSLIFAPTGGWGGSGAEMSAEFNFSTSTTLTLLVGGGGGGFYTDTVHNGGGGGSFVVEGSTPLVIAGGGGGGGDADVYSGGNGNVSTNGGSGGGVYGGTGGTGGGGGGVDMHGYGGGGGGGFIGNGNTITNHFAFSSGYGGYSFENGGSGGSGGFGVGGTPDGGPGGYGGGGGGANPSGYDSGGGGGGYSGGGGGHFGYGGGGGGSIIDSSAITNLAEVSGILSPDDRYNGEIIITAVPTPLVITTHSAFGFTNGVFGFNVIGPSGSNVAIQASTDLQTWIPLQTNLLGSGPLHFSDSQSPANPRRFYRAQLSPPAYTVGGTLTGLPAGNVVILQDNGSDNLTLSTNGTFTFPTALPNGYAYSVTLYASSGGVFPCTLTNGSGTISGANVTNVAVGLCLTCPALTGNPDVDMLNAAVADGTDNGGCPGIMLTENGGPFLVTAISLCTHDVAITYSGWARFATIVAPGSCSSTTFPVGTHVIQFGHVVNCFTGGPCGY